MPRGKSCSRILQGSIPSQIWNPWIRPLDTTHNRHCPTSHRRNATNHHQPRQRTNKRKGNKQSHKKLKRKKSVGPVEIPNEIFIEGNRSVRNTLLKTYNRIHSTEEITPSWLKGEIIRLYKGKGKKGKCSNKRGITLASNVGKVYERIINERVKQHVVITNAQAGGIESNSTVDHPIVLKQTVKEITSKKLTAYVVFLDVQKAYNKAWLDAILYVLMKNRVEGKNLSIIKKTQQ